MSTTADRRNETGRRPGPLRGGEPSALPPLSEAPNRRLAHARPAGVVGRTKPTKARKLLRRMTEAHDAADDARIVAGLDALLDEGRV